MKVLHIPCVKVLEPGQGHIRRGSCIVLKSLKDFWRAEKVKAGQIVHRGGGFVVLLHYGSGILLVHPDLAKAVRCTQPEPQPAQD